MDLNIDALLTPIPGDNSAGQDKGISNEADDLKEARRSDDPTLAQGEWGKKIKEADWSKVENIALDVITTKSKDLQFAVWLVEAWTQKYQFDGLNQGLLFTRRLLEIFWDNLYPIIEDNDLSYRVAKLLWLNDNLSSVIYSLPLCSGESGKYSWHDIKQARETDHLDRKDPEAMKKAIAEGNLTQKNIIDKALIETSDDLILENYELLKHCQQNFIDLNGVIDKLFVIKAIPSIQKETNVAPSLKELGSAIDNVYDFITGIAKDRRLIGIGHDMFNDDLGSNYEQTMSDKSVPEKRQAYSKGTIQTREDALRVLSEVSLFFKRSEPHSPIYYLLDRAVRWGNMPLDQWLQEMINEGWNDLPTLLKLIGKQESS